MAVVTANDLKTKGISDIERLLQSSRGRDQRQGKVTLRGDGHRTLRLSAGVRLLAAWQQRREDVAAGHVAARTRRAHSPESRADSPMSYSLVFTEHYEGMERRFVRRIPICWIATTRRWPCWSRPLHPSLRLHPLGGQLAGLHAVSINLQYHITLELELRERESSWSAWAVMERCIDAERGNTQSPTESPPFDHHCARMYTWF